MFYGFPFLGKLVLLRKLRLIIPTLRYSDLKRRKHAGGIRPQIVNMKTGELEMGDKTIVGDGVIFNTTPSPGASVCLANAKRDVEKIVQMLGPGYSFDKAGWERDLEAVNSVTSACAKDPKVCPGV
jgi:malate dehydrogenase (quinone)